MFYRVACNLKRAHNFDDLSKEINQVDFSFESLRKKNTAQIFINIIISITKFA